MPRISEFFGILIYMYFGDHDPPHFHALYGEYEAIISIPDGEVLQGSLPRKQLAIVLRWSASNWLELMANWYACQINQPPTKIVPPEKNRR